MTMALGGNQATHFSLLLTTFTSSDIRLSTGHNHSVCLTLLYHTIHLFTMIVLLCWALGQAHAFYSEPEADHCLPVCGFSCPAQSVLGRTMFPPQVRIPFFNCLSFASHIVFFRFYFNLMAINKCSEESLAFW